MADDHSKKAEISDADAATTSSRGEVLDLAAADENPNPSTEESKKVEFSEDEETLIIRMHNLVGDRWPLIAGRIPGRSAEEIEKFWISRHDSTNQKTTD